MCYACAIPIILCYAVVVVLVTARGVVFWATGAPNGHDRGSCECDLCVCVCCVRTEARESFHGWTYLESGAC